MSTGLNTASGTTTMTQDGTLVRVPREVGKKIGLEDGDEIKWVYDQDGLILGLRKQGEDKFTKL